MILLTDTELRSELSALGYDVPQIVIFSWGKYKKSNPDSRRTIVERWLRFLRHEPKSRTVLFPQFLAIFDSDIRRKIQLNTEHAPRPLPPARFMEGMKSLNLD